jgi:hypothetical protein
MPAENPPGYPYPAGQDPERTIAYRTPQGSQPQQPPQPPYGGPQPPQAHQPSGHDYGQTQHLQQPAFGGDQWRQPEELGYGAPPPTAKAKKKGRGWIIAIVAALLVGVVAGGGVWAAAKLSGGGTQPHEVLPGNAIAYVRLDLDPAANQKVALFNIARKFTATKDTFSGDDPRKALFEAFRKDAMDPTKIDYAKDVEPWLGDRIGLAILPANGGEDPGAAVAVQVKDEDAARASIPKLFPAQEKTGIAFRDDYAILAETQAKADTYAKAAPLSENTTFADDLDALGEPGLLSFWANLGEAAKLSGVAAAGDPTMLDSIKNARFAGALRFDSDYVELTGIARGADSGVTSEPEAVKIGELPASTVGALSISGLGEAFGKQWPKIQKAAQSTSDGQAFTQALTQAQQSFGLVLPDDVVTLLGKSLSVAVDEQGLDGSMPNVGAVLTTDPAKAQEVLGKLEKAAAANGSPSPLVKVPGDGKLVVATSQDYATKLAAEGTLGDSETFKLAVPDADSATFAAFVDLDKIEKFYLQGMQGDEKANAQVLRGVGMSGKYSGNEGDFTLRVLFN